MAKAAATAKNRRPKQSNSNSNKSVMGLPIATWIASARRTSGSEVRSGSRAFLTALSSRDSKLAKASLSDHLNKWQMTLLLASEAELHSFQGSVGPVTVVRSVSSEKSGYTRMRDAAGAALLLLLPHKAEKLVIDARGLSREERQGLLVGLEMATYTFAENRGNSRRPRKTLPQILIRAGEQEFTDQEIREASLLASSVNIARHLVNTPGGDLNPKSYADCLVSMFAGSRTVTVDVIEGDRLEEERMGLIQAVGGGAAELPRLVHLRYRPISAKGKMRPLALVGKGITFDTGGLDIKPSSGMRWMKKDMGGSAACAAIAKWAELSNLERPLDIYIALAENAIGSKAFRPGDIITARNGLTIEIHNTDAEGRLVLADALDYAATRTGDDEPSAIINLATLTGAIKVGLGADIAGLFTNSDRLAEAISGAGQEMGELSWRMPLHQPYRALLRSTFADYTNSSDGFAGAITAALFLELFVGKKPWAHLDIYAWKDSAGGAYSEGGGNGQGVQMLAKLLKQYSEVGPEGSVS